MITWRTASCCLWSVARGTSATRTCDLTYPRKVSGGTDIDLDILKLPVTLFTDFPRFLIMDSNIEFEELL